MRVAFLGTPPIAAASLRALLAADDITVVAAVTNPDRARGRSGNPEPPPVKVTADNHDVRVLQPERVVEIAGELAALDLDAAAVVAYGAILPAEILEVAAHGFVNLHFSLLPRWRGAAPVQHAIAAGDTTTGVTTFVLDEGMDTGPILAQREIEIGDDETAGELLDRLTDIGAPLLVDSVRRLVNGATPDPQPTDGATLAPKLDSDDVRIDWTRPATDLVNLVRAANPRPGAWTTFRGERLKVHRARRAQVAVDARPGEITSAVDRDGPVVATGDGGVELRAVQPAGKTTMDGVDFVNGYQPTSERLGTIDGAAG